MRFTLDAEDRIAECDEAFRALARELGVSEPIGIEFGALWPRRVLEVCGPTPDAARQQGRAQTFFTLTGVQTRHYRLDVEPAAGVGVAGRIVDLTQAPPALGEPGDARFAALTANVTELVIVVDRSQALVAFNPTFAASAEALTGRPLRIGDALEEVFEPASRPQVAALMQRALDGEAFLTDVSLLLRGGLLRTYEMSVNAFRENGEVVAAVCLARNVTDRRVEAASRHAILSASPDAIVVLRRDGLVTDYYPSRDVPLHLDRDQIVGQNIDAFTFLDIPAMRRHLERTFATAETQVIEYEVMIRGELRRRESRLRAISADEAIFIIRDVTEARRLMGRLVTTDRMAALGTMAAGVAHELNNPLAFVSANLELMANHMGTARPFIQQAVTVAQEGLARMAAIVRDLNSFARSDDDRAVVDVGMAIDFALRMTRSTLQPVTSVEKEGALDARVCISESRLGQVLVNLLVNAAHAFAEGTDPRTNRVLVRVATEGDQVVLEVADNGQGMSAATQARVFDPFFTTKPAGIGTGLGLWVVQGIVRGVGGEIEVESEEGRGTTFRVRLPRSEQAPRVALIGTRARRRRVLLVDDDPTVLESLARVLELIHDVVPVGSAEGALTLVSVEAPDGFDVVLCDLTMPGSSGIEVLEALAAQGNRARLILMTGAAVDERLRARLGRIGAVALAKPFKLADVESLIG